MVDYAEQMLRKNILRPATSAFSFCEPEFFNGSAFYIENKMLYDRIYCGALVPNNHRVYFCQMLKVGGILVMPYGSRVSLRYIHIVRFHFLVTSNCTQRHIQVFRVQDLERYFLTTSQPNNRNILHFKAGSITIDAG